MLVCWWCSKSVNNLEMEEVRIVLRTGQPGYAPEESVIKEYDINDYKTKTELTRSKLVTSIISSIRSYQQIRTINQNRLGLQKIINAGANLLEQHSLHEFSEGVVTQISSLIGLHAEGVLCAQIEDDGSASDNVYVLGAAGHYAPFIKCKLERLEITLGSFSRYCNVCSRNGIFLPALIRCCIWAMLSIVRQFILKVTDRLRTLTDN